MVDMKTMNEAATPANPLDRFIKTDPTSATTATPSPQATPGAEPTPPPADTSPVVTNVKALQLLQSMFLQIFKDIPAEQAAQLLPLEPAKVILDIVGWERFTYIIRGKGGQAMTPEATFWAGAGIMGVSFAWGVVQANKIRKNMSEADRQAAAKANLDSQKELWKKMQDEVIKAAAEAQKERETTGVAT